MPRPIARERNGPKAEAPLWQTSPILPLLSCIPLREDEEHAQMSSLMLARPRQFGPEMRTPVSRATLPSSSCKLSAFLDAALGESGGYDYARARSFFCALAQDGYDAVVRHYYANGVGAFGQVGDAGIALESEKFVIAGVDGIYVHAVSGLHDGAQKASTVLHPPGGADDGDGAGVEHLVDGGELGFCPVGQLGFSLSGVCRNDTLESAGSFHYPTLSSVDHPHPTEGEGVC